MIDKTKMRGRTAKRKGSESHEHILGFPEKSVVSVRFLFILSAFFSMCREVEIWANS